MSYEKITHLDLFSGIGGFSLAADRVFGNVSHTFVEWDPFCQEVLRKHWPEAEISGDIDRFAEELLLAHADCQADGGMAEQPRQEIPKHRGVHLITGGFPCQPFSHAGRRKGTADDRYKWPQMLACVSVLRPEWVVAENVSGLASWNDGLVLETVCSDLEAQGYDVQPFVIPAAAVGAPHRRDRVWIVANRRREHGSSGSGDLLRPKEQDINTSDTQCSHRVAEDATNAKGTGLEAGRRKKEISRSRDGHWQEDWSEVAARLCRVDDGIPTALDRDRLLEYIGKYEPKRKVEIQETGATGDKTDTMRIMRSYLKAAKTALSKFEGVEQGKNLVSEMSRKRGLDKGKMEQRKEEKQEMFRLWELVSSSPLKEAQDLLAEMPIGIREAQRYVALASQRTPRLKSLGNAIVPQVAEEIFKAIKLAESPTQQ